MNDIHDEAQKRAIERARQQIAMERERAERIEAGLEAEKLEREDKVNAAKHGASRGRS